MAEGDPGPMAEGDPGPMAEGDPGRPAGAGPFGAAGGGRPPGGDRYREAGARALERARAYVEMESPSGDDARLRALGERLAADLMVAGAAVEVIDSPGSGCHVLARAAGAEPGLDHLLVLGHFDTVWPAGTLEERPFREHGELAEGPGIYDMKAPVAVLVETLAGMRDAGAVPRRPLEVLLTSDEETGSLSSRDLIERRARGAAAVLVLEPPLPGGAAKTARKGVSNYLLRVRGRSAHAGIEPERGVSAVVELALQIPRILELADPSRGTTVNIAPIGGGTAANVVAAEAWAGIETRYASAAEAARIDAAIRELRPALPGARLHLEVGDRRPPLERSPAVVGLFHRVRELAAELGIVLEEGSTGGGSDGCLTAALGVPTLDGLGVDGGGAHAQHEHILVGDLPRRVALLRRLLERL